MTKTILVAAALFFMTTTASQAAIGSGSSDIRMPSIGIILAQSACQRLDAAIADTQDRLANTSDSSVRTQLEHRLRQLKNQRRQMGC